MSNCIPCLKYHKELAPDGRVIRTHEEHEALGTGWKNSPAFEEAEPVELEPQAEQPAELPLKQKKKKG